MTLAAAGPWYDFDTTQPPVGDAVLVIVLRRHPNKDWEWERPRFDVLDDKARWTVGSNMRLTTMWASVQFPPLPECLERQESIEAARRYADLRARQTALDREFSEHFRLQMFGRDEATKETA